MSLLWAGAGRRLALRSDRPVPGSPGPAPRESGSGFQGTLAEHSSPPALRASGAWLVLVRQPEGAACGQLEVTGYLRVLFT